MVTHVSDFPSKIAACRATLPGSARAQDILGTDFLSTVFPLKPPLTFPLALIAPLGASFPSPMPLSSLLPGLAHPDPLLFPKRGHNKGFGDQKTSKVATDEQASQGGLCFGPKNDWTWDWGQSQKKGARVPPGGGRGAVDVEVSSKALGKGSLREATVVSSSLLPALPFLPSLIQTSGSHKELLKLL